MDKYQVKLLAKAFRDLDNIYSYITEEFKEVATANSIIESLEKNILGLSEMPHRGALRRVGAYANKGYRHIFVKNYTIVYRIDEKRKQVIIVTVRYSPSDF